MDCLLVTVVTLECISQSLYDWQNFHKDDVEIIIMVELIETCILGGPWTFSLDMSLP